MAIQNIQVWADNLEEVKLPQIDAELVSQAQTDAAFASEISALSQNILDQLALTSVNTEVAQESADTAQDTALATSVQVYETGLQSRTYAATLVQQLRDEIQGQFNTLGGTITATIGTEVGSSVDGILPNLTAEIDAALSKAQAAVDALDLPGLNDVNNLLLNDILPGQQQDIDAVGGRVDSAQNQLSNALAGFNFDSVVEGFDAIINDTVDMLSPLGHSRFAGSAALWTVTPDSTTLSAKAPPVQAHFLTDDPSFGACYEFPAGTNAIGQRNPVAFSVDKIYLLEVTLRVTDNGVFTPGVGVNVGATTWGPDGLVEHNVETPYQTVQVSENEVTLRFYATGNPEFVGQAFSDTVLNLSGSVEATQAFFHVRQNGGGGSDGRMRASVFSVVDITEIIENAEKINTRLNFELPRLNTTEEAIEDVFERMMDLQNKQFATDQRLVGAGITVDEETGEVRIAAFERTLKMASDVSIVLSALESSIALKASVAYVNQAVSEAVLDPSQIPALSDLQARVTDAELAVDAERGRIDGLVSNFTVNGTEVTLTDVQSSLDAMTGEIADRVTSTTFNEATMRLTTAEQKITAFGDAASIKDSVEATRTIMDEIGDLTEQSIADVWNRWTSDKDLTEAIAAGRRELKARVDDNLNAEAFERLQLQAKVEETEARLMSESLIRVAGDKAVAAMVDTLRLDFEDPDTGLEATATALEGLKTQIDDSETGLVATAVKTTNLEAAITDEETGLEANAGALTTLGGRVEDTEDGLEVLAGRTELLESALGSTNMVPNSRFNTGDFEGWLSTPPEFSVSVRGTGPVGQSTAPTPYVAILAYSASNSVAVIADHDAVPGDSFRGSFRGAINLGEEGAVRLQFLFFDAGGAIIGVNAQSFALSYTWTRYLLDPITAPENTTTVRIRLIRNGGGTGACYVTDIRAEKEMDGVSSLTARVSNVETAYVDAAGSVAAVNQAISATYGDITAMAESTAFAKATLDGIAEGFVWKLGGEDVLSLVQTSDGTTPPVSTARIGGEYIRLDGNVEVTGSFQVSGTQVILNADTQVNGDFRVNGNLIVGGSVDTAQIKDNALSRSSAATGSLIAVSNAGWTTVAELDLPTVGGVPLVIQATASLFGQDGGTAGTTGMGSVRLLISGAVEYTSRSYQNMEVPILVLGTSAAGTTNLKLQALKTAGDGNFDVDGTLMGIELKK